MIEITEDDVKKYIEAQKLKSYRCPISRVLYKQNRYRLFRFKASGLTMQKYLKGVYKMARKRITDKQERYIEKKIGDGYNFSNLTSYEAIGLISLIEKHYDYNYLIFRNRGIDSKLKAIEERINANGMEVINMLDWLG